MVGGPIISRSSVASSDSRARQGDCLNLSSRFASRLVPSDEANFLKTLAEISALSYLLG